MNNLDEFKNMLQKRKATILEILHTRNSNVKTLQTNFIKDDSDLVSASIQGQIDTLLIEKYKLELQEVENSLQKITQGVYGICEMCDGIIDEERLRAKPHAKYCITCRTIYEKSKIIKKETK